jgi:hypothetical protein
MELIKKIQFLKISNFINATLNTICFGGLMTEKKRIKHNNGFEQ